MAVLREEPDRLDTLRVPAPRVYAPLRGVAVVVLLLTVLGRRDPALARVVLLRRTVEETLLGARRVVGAAGGARAAHRLVHQRPLSLVLELTPRAQVRLAARGVPLDVLLLLGRQVLTRHDRFRRARRRPRAAVVGGVAGASRLEICHQLPNRHHPREALVARRAHELLDVALPLRVVGRVVLEHLQHLLRGAAEHVPRLVAELRLDHPEQSLVRRARLARLRPVRSVRLRVEHARLLRAPALALRRVRVEVVLVHPARGVFAFLLGLLHALIELGRPTDVRAVAERSRLDAAPQRLRRAAGLAGDALRAV
mmetsp:Transcript_3062/g.12232  ORF Transcript_3062/g.12232 Transcript_3062/m.12232 type:complete len:311 (-) Transcript_3062:228-1160(-)